MTPGLCMDSNKNLPLKSNYIYLQKGQDYRHRRLPAYCPKFALEKYPEATGALAYPGSRLCFAITSKDVVKGNGQKGIECTVFSQPDDIVKINSEKMEKEIESLQKEAQKMSEMKEKLDDGKISVTVGWCMGADKKPLKHDSLFHLKTEETYMTAGKCLDAVLMQNPDATGAIHDSKEENCYGVTSNSITEGDSRYQHYTCIVFKK